MKLKNILLAVNDIQASREFYNTLFGLEVIGDFGGNLVLTEGLVLQERTGFEALTGKETVYGGHDRELYFEEYDLERFLDLVRKFQVPVLNECAADSTGNRVIRIYDPDFHVIEVREMKAAWTGRSEEGAAGAEAIETEAIEKAAAGSEAAGKEAARE